MCSLDSNQYNKVNLLCNQLRILEKASTSRFSASDYAFASRNENFSTATPFPVGVFTFEPTTLDSQNITLQGDNATFQVKNAGIYQVILVGSIRNRQLTETSLIFVYQLTINPSTTTAIHALRAQRNPAFLTTEMRINELVKLPANGTMAVNILLNENETTVAGSLDINIVPITISIIRIK